MKPSTRASLDRADAICLALGLPRASEIILDTDKLEREAEAMEASWNAQKLRATFDPLGEFDNVHSCPCSEPIGHSADRCSDCLADEADSLNDAAGEGC